MSLSLLLSKLPLMNALFCAGISVYVLSRDSKNRINRYFSLGLAVIGLMEFGNYMYQLNAPFQYPLIWKKVALAGEILLPGTWLTFSLSYGRDPSYFSRNRNLLIAVYLVSAGFLAGIVFEPSLVPDVLLGKAEFSFSVFLILVLVFTVANFEMTLRTADHTQRWRSKFLILGIAPVFLFLF